MATHIGYSDDTNFKDKNLAAVNTQTEFSIDQDWQKFSEFQPLKSRDFNAMRLFLEQTTKRRLAMNDIASLQFIAQVSNALVSWETASIAESNEAAALAASYAKEAISKNKNMPSSLRISLMQSSLRYQLKELRTTSGKDFDLKRKEAATMWVETIIAFEKELDPTFDVNDPKNFPSMNVPVPLEGFGISGIPPSFIKDPVARQKYKNDLKNEAEKSQKLWSQKHLRLIQSSFLTSAHNYLKRAYSTKPDNVEELRLLVSRIKDANFKENIVSEVRQSLPATP